MLGELAPASDFLGGPETANANFALTIELANVSAGGFDGHDDILLSAVPNDSIRRSAMDALRFHGAATHAD